MDKWARWLQRMLDNGVEVVVAARKDLLRKAKQIHTTRQGWRRAGAQPGWQQNQAHDLSQSSSRVCCTPRLWRGWKGPLGATGVAMARAP